MSIPQTRANAIQNRRKPLPFRKSPGRADFLWKACEVYTRCFRLFPSLPLYLDVQSHRLCLVKSIPKLLLWFILAFGGVGGINFISKFLQFLYLFVIPEKYSGRTPEDYKEFSSVIQLTSVALTILCSGSTPVVGLFLILFGKPAAQTIDELLEIEDTLEKRKPMFTCKQLFYNIFLYLLFITK